MMGVISDALGMTRNVTFSPYLSREVRYCFIEGVESFQGQRNRNRIVFRSDSTGSVLSKVLGVDEIGRTDGLPQADFYDIFNGSPRHVVVIVHRAASDMGAHHHIG
jgi:hypothetical protein